MKSGKSKDTVETNRLIEFKKISRSDGTPAPLEP